MKVKDKASTTKIDVTFASGWIRGRLAVVDETTGNEEIVAGLDVRIRASRIITYYAGSTGVIVIWVDRIKDPIDIIGSMATLDKIMQRAALKEIG